MGELGWERCEWVTWDGGGGMVGLGWGSWDALQRSMDLLHDHITPALPPHKSCAFLCCAVQIGGPTRLPSLVTTKQPELAEAVRKACYPAFSPESIKKAFPVIRWAQPAAV